MYSTDCNGDSIIPASQRPDGTWRKARRVKEGYVPQEEVPLYESKGKQVANRQAKPLQTTEPLPTGQKAHQTIPGLFISEDKEKNKKKHKTKGQSEEQVVTKQISQLKIKQPTTEAKTQNKADSQKQQQKQQIQEQQQDPQKKLKNLKKRLREVEALEQKIKSGELANPEPEQLTKLKRKDALKKEIAELERVK